MKNCSICMHCGEEDEPNNNMFGTATPSKILICRKHAPKMFSGSGEGWSNQLWPPVKSTDWCGEFEPKQPSKFILLYRHEYGESVWTFGRLEILLEHAKAIAEAKEYDGMYDELFCIDLTLVTVSKIDIEKLKGEQ